MFTKYTDIDLPKNYSGNRFKQAIPDTKMKTHRAQDSSAYNSVVKTAVSPSFQDIIDKTAKESDSEPIEEDDKNITVSTEEAPLENTTEADIPIDAPPRGGEKMDENLLRLFKESGLGRLLNNKSRDDFLLIGLIALLASDGAGDNLEAIILLALLLLYS